MDLTRYLPTDNQTWIPVYAERMGWDNLREYYNHVFLRIISMKPMEEFDIVKNVNQERYDLFIHCAVTAIHEAELYSGKTYHIENQATVILCR